MLPVILLLDKDQDTRETLKELFQIEFPFVGFLQTDSPREGQVLFSKWRDNIALILIEDHFVGRFTPEFCNWFRKVGYTLDMVAFFDLPETMRRMTKAGCNLTLPKPFNIEEIFTIAIIALEKYYSQGTMPEFGL